MNSAMAMAPPIRYCSVRRTIAGRSSTSNATSVGTIGQVRPPIGEPRDGGQRRRLGLNFRT